MIDWGLAVGAGIKALGSLLGTILALVFKPPKSQRDFIMRGTFSFISGFVFGEPAREQFLRWPETWTYWVAASALVALISWALWGALVRAVVRAIDAWKPKDEDA